MKEIDNIIENYINGNLTDVVTLIKEYGVTFFEDLDFHTVMWLPSRRIALFMGIAKLYFRRTWEET